MATAMDLKNEIAKKVQDLLKEHGLEASVRSSDHEVLVNARKMIDRDCLRIVFHASDREPVTAAAGGAVREVARARLAQIAIRPTLAAQAASRTKDAGTGGKDPCN